MTSRSELASWNTVGSWEDAGPAVDSWQCSSLKEYFQCAVLFSSTSLENVSMIPVLFNLASFSALWHQMFPWRDACRQKEMTFSTYPFSLPQAEHEEQSASYVLFWGKDFPPVDDSITSSVSSWAVCWSLTIFGVGSGERYCCSVIPCSDAEIHLLPKYCLHLASRGIMQYI